MSDGLFNSSSAFDYWNERSSEAENDRSQDGLLPRSAWALSTTAISPSLGASLFFPDLQDAAARGAVGGVYDLGEAAMRAGNIATHRDDLAWQESVARDEAPSTPPSGANPYEEDWWEGLFSEGDQELRSHSRALARAPSVQTEAGRFIFGLSKSLTVGAIGWAAGPIGSALALGAAYSVPAYDQGIEDGLTHEQALQMAYREGGSMALMGLLPAAAPGRIATRVLSGAAINTAAGVASRYESHRYLESIGRSDLATRYQAFDREMLLTDALLGANFSGKRARRALEKKKAAERADRITRAQVNGSVTLNLTPSMPIGFYLKLGRGPLPRGMRAGVHVVDITTPEIALALWNDAALAPALKAAGYQSISEFRLLKYVAAVEGDTVSAQETEVCINGKKVADRFSPTEFARGMRCPPDIWSGERTLGPNEVFLLSERDPKSDMDPRFFFDGRYTGPIASSVVYERFEFLPHDEHMEAINATRMAHGLPPVQLPASCS